MTSSSSPQTSTSPYDDYRSPCVFQFKVTLNNTKPPIWRRIQVPAEYDFYRLHLAIQSAMGWNNAHSHSFTQRQRRTFNLDKRKLVNIRIVSARGMTSHDLLHEDDTLDEKWALIQDFFQKKGDRATYLYDPWDRWSHKVVFEGEVAEDGVFKYPRCTAGRRACPPEECGGPEGYAAILKVVSDASHPEHLNELRWLSSVGYDWEDLKADEFDPASVDFRLNLIFF